MPHSDHRVTAVLFDVDGTLVDSNYVQALTWWQALREQGHLVPMAQIHRAVGLGSDKILDHLLGEVRDHSSDDEMVAGHATLAAAWYERLVALPGAADLLRACAGSGLTVVLATSASTRNLKVFRRILDVDDILTATTSADDADRSKPDTDILEVALGRIGVTPSNALFVGDSVWDMMAATRLGMRCVGVSCGGTSAQELIETGAAEVWRDPAEVLERLSETLLRRTASTAGGPLLA